MKRLGILTSVALLALAGCAGLEKSIHEDDMRRAHAQCSEYGFPPDSVPFSQCMQTAVHNIESQRAADFRNQMARNHGNAGTSPAAPSISLDFGKSTSTSVTNEIHVTQPPNVTCTTVGNAGRCQ
ncbi:MAG: hypothetical protein JSR53_04600 [Proteobacteria bacterium]|nr:hypothetical protein [Pseudomonadota bacterium]